MVEWLPIYELFDFEKGSLQSSKCTQGKYTFVTAAEDWKTHNSFTHDCEALIFAMAASGSLGRTHYIKDKFISSDLCFILTPKEGRKIDLPFYYRVFNFIREDIVKKTATGTSKLAINRTSFGNYSLPYFDFDHQLLYREKIDKIASIKESLAAGFTSQQDYLSQLRQAILQEAIEGKLTADWRTKHPVKKGDPNTDAAALLEHIKAEKQKLIAEGKLKKEKPLGPIKPEEIPFEVPNGWVWCKLGEIGQGFQYGSSAKSLKYGTVPVLRMGNIQNGVVNLDDLVFTNNKKEIEKYTLSQGDLLFNRTNSRQLVGKTAIFLSDQPAIYAGYLVRFQLTVSICNRYANVVMNSKFHRKWCDEVKVDALGQSNINATKLRDFRFPLPPFTEQQAIVERVDRLLGMVDELQQQVKARQTQAEQLMQSVLREAFEGN